MRAWGTRNRISICILRCMQVVGGLSRTMCALMSAMPPRFSIDSMTLSDSEASRRFGIKPQTVVEALYLCQRDVLLGFLAAAFGIIHDPAAGKCNVLQCVG